MKERRHKAILEIIRENKVKTQEELIHYLKDKGFETTQSTVSRDIKELNLLKVTDSFGDSIYSSLTRKRINPETATASLEISDPDYETRIKTVFKESVLTITPAYFLIIIHTLPGMAQAAAHTIDILNLEQIAGTIAGDDTIFIAVKNEEDVDELVELFTKLMV